ncbi:aquaporin AQPAn.G-like [Lampetra planeri]
MTCDLCRNLFRLLHSGSCCRKPSVRAPTMTAFRGVFTRPFLRALASELAGTALFLLLSLGSVVAWAGSDSSPGVTHTSLAFGLSLATAVHCFGHVSGAHLNPAVTVAMLAARRTTLAKAALYVVAQCLGATVGAGLLVAVTPEEFRGSLGVTRVRLRQHIDAPLAHTTHTTHHHHHVLLPPSPLSLHSPAAQVREGLGVGRAFLVEAAATLLLVLAVFSAGDARRRDSSSGPLAIGLSVTAGHLFAIPYTGASMNPARSLGPALLMGSFDDHWVYWLGPTVGAVVAGAAYRFLLCPDLEPPARGPSESRTDSEPQWPRWPEQLAPRDDDERLAVVHELSPPPHAERDPERLVLSPTVHVIQLERSGGDHAQRKRSSSEL